MIVSNGGGSHTYTARVSESCLAIHGCAWLPPGDPGVIAQLVLDAEAGPEVRSVIPDPGGPGTVRLVRAPVIRTGIAMGPVTVTVTTHDGAPPVDLDESDDAAEFSIFAVNRPAFVGGFDDAALRSKSIDFAGPEWYRLRLHASGRTAARDLVVKEPVENYRIDLWRASYTEPLALTRSVTESAAARARRDANMKRSAAQRSERLAQFLNRSQHPPARQLSAEDRAALTRGQDRLRELAARRRRQKDD